MSENDGAFDVDLDPDAEVAAGDGEAAGRQSTRSEFTTVSGEHEKKRDFSELKRQASAIMEAAIPSFT